MNSVMKIPEKQSFFTITTVKIGKIGEISG